MALQIKRGLDAGRTFTPVAGELIFTTDTKRVFVGDGSTVGGVAVSPVTSVFGRVGAVVATTGDYTTAQITESGSLYFTETRVRSTVLTGFSSTNSAITAADSVLVAFGKTQGQLDNKQGLNSVLTSITGQSSGTGLLKLTNGVASLDSSAYLTANQTITLSGDVTGSGTTAISTAISAATVTGKLLTGYTVRSNTAVAATDTILAAFGKLQGQVSAREATIAAGTTAQYYRGDKTWQTLNTANVAESSNQYFTEPRVRSTVLTGFAANNAAITATDTVLAAFGKTQGQLDNKQGLNSVLTSITGQSSGTGLLKLTNGVASLDSSAYMTASATIDGGTF